MKKRTGLTKDYIHGFTKEEQIRLFDQARVHEDLIFGNVEFGDAKKILEVGSGVGAQTQLLLERYPEAHIQCVDASSAQVKAAREALAQPLKTGRVSIDKADALHLPYRDNAFDGAFLCWFLEHVQAPVDILQEVRRVLRSGGTVYCNEVLNATFYLHPYSPNTLKFWLEFNDYQWSIKGDPFVGGKLANFLIQAGYQNISTKVLTHQYDNRMPKKRAHFLDYWCKLLLSAAPGLLKEKRVDAKIVDGMREEFRALRTDPNAVIFYSWILARAEAF
jgi:ubiquinone/menaquinone biosynthesis C-methylase UbiE